MKVAVLELLIAGEVQLVEKVVPDCLQLTLQIVTARKTLDDFVIHVYLSGHFCVDD